MKKIFLLVVFALATQLTVAQVFERSIGLPISGGRFRNAWKVQVDQFGAIYVLDDLSKAVAKLSPGLTGMTNIGSTYPGITGQMKDVAVDGNGNIFIATSSDVYKFASNGSYVLKFSDSYFSVSEVGGIAVDYAGTLYVSDYHGSRILQFTNHGILETEFASSGSIDLSRPAGIDVVGTTLHVFDVNDYAIKQLDLWSSSFFAQFGSEGNGSGQFYTFGVPTAIAVDQFGNTYVADAANTRVQKLTESGTFDSQIGTTGVYSTVDGSLSFVTGVAVDAMGNIYTADGRLQKFNGSGEWVATAAPNANADGMFNGPSDVAVDSQGNLYVTDGRNHRIQKFSADGTFITKWGTHGSGDGQFSGPRGIAINDQDVIYVADYGNNRIQMFNTSGEFLGKWGTGTTDDNDIRVPELLTVDEDDNVYVTSVAGNQPVVKKFTSSGIYVLKWGGYGLDDGKFYYINDIEADKNGYIYVVDQQLGRITKFTTDGVFSTHFGKIYNPNDGDGMPYTMFFDVNKNININTGVQTDVFTSSGTLINKWLPSVDNIPATGQATVANSRLYIVNAAAHEVDVFVLPAPITLSTYTARAGETVRINGLGFNQTAENNIVRFGAVKATISTVTDAYMDVIVPAGATYAPVSVTHDGVTSWTPEPFRITFPTTGSIDASTFSLVTVYGGEDIGAADVVTGDLDGDGKADLVVMNKDLPGISILRNQTVGGNFTDESFAPPINITTSSIFDVKLADLDNDGRLDIVLADFSAQVISIVRNASTPGSISMEPKQDFAFYPMVTNLALADVDGDGRTDIISAFNSNYVAVLRNKTMPGGLLSFIEIENMDVSYGVSPDQIMDMKVVDINLDNRPELVIGTTNLDGHSIRIYENLSGQNPYDVWATPHTKSLDGGVSVGQIAVADLDGDLHPEIIATSTSEQIVRVFPNLWNGNPPFTFYWELGEYITLLTPGKLIVADANGDGRPDILVGSETIPTYVSVFNNQVPTSIGYDASYFSRFELEVGNQGFSVGDLDGDSRTDIVGVNLTQRRVSLVQTVTNLPYINSVTPSSAAVGEAITINGTGFSSDVAVYIGAGKATVLNATETQITVTVPPGATYGPVSLTIDGYTTQSPSAFSTTFSAPAVLDANSFEDPVEVLLFQYSNCMAVADFDGDGNDDFAVPAEDAVYVFRNKDTPGTINPSSFVYDRGLVIQSTAEQLASADIDGDGRRDIVASTSTGFWILRNTSTGIGNVDFSEWIPVSQNGVTSFSLCDIDGDGKVDIGFTTVTNHLFGMLKNESEPGSVSFSSPLNGPQDGAPTYKVLFSDIDGDRRSDAISTFGTSNPFIKLNQGGPGVLGTAYWKTGAYFHGSEPVAEVVGADLNRDGINDVIVFRESGVALHKSPEWANGVFLYGTGNTTHGTVAHLDGDDRPDLVTANGASSSISVYKNRTTGQDITQELFEPRFELSTPSAVSFVAVYDVDNDGRKDIIGVSEAASKMYIYRNRIANPEITEINPPNAPVGATVTIVGSGFPVAPIVKFNGEIATVNSSSYTTIEVVVPDAATNGPLTVESAGVVATGSSDFVVLRPPEVGGFDPNNGPVGTPVTIFGAEFGATPSENIVMFNGVAATVVSSTATTINVHVPEGATSGPVSVSVNGLSGESTQTFTVTEPVIPTIIDFSPLSGQVGTSVTISGENFSETPAVNVVKFNGVNANVTISANASLEAVVPEGATSGPITVTIGTNTATSLLNFTVLTGEDNTPPIITDNTPSSVNPGTPLQIAAAVTDIQSGVSRVDVEYRSVTTGTLKTVSTSLSGTTYSATIPAVDIGELGVEYRIVATSGGGTAVTTGSNGATYKLVKLTPGSGSNGLTIPYSAYGENESNYRIIAVPMELSANLVGSVFNELGVEDKSKWRMFHYKSGSTQEMGLTSIIEPGKGYWLIVKTSGSPLNSGAGTTVQATIDNPFQVNLVFGWNQIGNPYNFNLLWEDVVNANPGLTNLRLYNGTFVNGTQLNKFEGGFVHVSSAMTLKFPVTKNPVANSGRTQEFVNKTNPIDDKEWEVNFVIRNGDLLNRISGFGMHHKASAEFDVFDGINMPEFFTRRLELKHNRKQGGDTYSKDIVPTAPSGEWTFEVETTIDEKYVTLEWDNYYFGDNDRALVLWDESRQWAIDMRKATSYTFDKSISKSFKVFYGPADEISGKVSVNSLVLHSVSPNPADGRVNIGFTTPAAGPVTISVVNMLGQVAFDTHRDFEAGYHEVTFGYNRETTTGLHIVQVKSGNTVKSYRIHLR